MTTLRDLVLKKPQGSGDFMEALLDITTSDLELVGVACLMRDWVWLHYFRHAYNRSIL